MTIWLFNFGYTIHMKIWLTAVTTLFLNGMLCNHFTSPWNEYPGKLHFIQRKVGFAFATVQKHRLWVLVRTASFISAASTASAIDVWIRNKKILQFFIWKYRFYSREKSFFFFFSNLIQSNSKLYPTRTMFGVQSYEYKCFIKISKCTVLSFLVATALQLLCQFTTASRSAKTPQKLQKLYIDNQ